MAVETETARNNRAVLQETNRHNLAQEDVANRNLIELTRHNYATESLTAQQIAANYEVGMANAAATRYAADVNASTQRYVANVNAQTSKWVTSMNASTQLLKSQRDNAAAMQRTQATNATNLQIRKSKENIEKVSTGTNLITSGVKTVATIAKLFI